MTHTLKLRQIGSSVGVIVPKDILARLNVSKGDNLYLVEGQEGYRVVANDPGFEKTMIAYNEVARQYRDVFKELSK